MVSICENLDLTVDLSLFLFSQLVVPETTVLDHHLRVVILTLA